MTRTGRRGIPVLVCVETAVAAARVVVTSAARAAFRSKKGQVMDPAMVKEAEIVRTMSKSFVKLLTAIAALAILLTGCSDEPDPTSSDAAVSNTTVSSLVFASVSAGDAHTCGVRRDGWVECWGEQARGLTALPGD